MWIDIVEIFRKYMGSGLIVIWFLASILYLYITEKRKDRRVLFVYLPIGMLLLYFNPLFSKVFCMMVGSEIYFRMCWLLPVILVVSYTVVKLIERTTGIRQVLYSLLAIFLMVVSGRLVYTNPLYSVAQNQYHVPQAVVELCDAIHVPGREVMAAFPRELVLYVRQYDATICMPYGREVKEVRGYFLSEELNAEVCELDKLVPYVQYFHCHYVIWDKQKKILGNPQDYGLELFDTVEGYHIYRNTAEDLSIPE